MLPDILPYCCACYFWTQAYAQTLTGAVAVLTPRWSVRV